MTFYTPISIAPLTILRTCQTWIIWKVGAKRTWTCESIKDQISFTNVRKTCRSIRDELVSDFALETESLRTSFTVGCKAGTADPIFIWIKTLVADSTVIIKSIETGGAVCCLALSNTRTVVIWENESIVTFVAYQLSSNLTDLQALISEIIDSATLGV